MKKKTSPSAGVIIFFAFFFVGLYFTISETHFTNLQALLISLGITAALYWFFGTNGPDVDKKPADLQKISAAPQKNIEKKRVTAAPVEMGTVASFFAAVGIFIGCNIAYYYAKFNVGQLFYLLPRDMIKYGELAMTLLLAYFMFSWAHKSEKIYQKIALILAAYSFIINMALNFI
ncbi:MAG: hypothetical protein LBU87_06585 [Lactobacillales bacterium]|jgi:hypothetical protein|nr:hypothetical protein [Lactobacillales bacterium]